MFYCFGLSETRDWKPLQSPRVTDVESDQLNAESAFVYSETWDFDRFVSIEGRRLRSAGGAS